MNSLLIGSKVKLNLNISQLQELTMDTYEFYVYFYTQPNIKLKLTKAKATRVDENNYIIALDTSKLTPGILKCEVIVCLPDSTFINGVREEVIPVPTKVVLSNTAKESPEPIDHLQGSSNCVTVNLSIVCDISTGTGSFTYEIVDNNLILEGKGVEIVDNNLILEGKGVEIVDNNLIIT